MSIPAWRLSLKPASYNGAGFFVDVHARASGRRQALHEFPKKEIPYLEDMGRRAKRFQIVAYVVGPDYEFDRDNLIDQLEVEGNGLLVHPTYPDVDTVGVDTYSVTERLGPEGQGGYAVFEIAFTEAGQSVSQQISVDTQSGVTGAVNGAVPTRSSSFGNDFSGSNDITALA